MNAAVKSIAVIKGPKFWTPLRRLAASRSPGRRPGRLAGGHVLDLADLLKAIALCGPELNNCVGKFASAKSGYVTKRNLPFVQSRCDGCDGFSPHAHLLVHHTLASNI